MKGAACALLGALSSVLVAVPVSAQDEERAPVRVSLEGCPDFAEARVRSVVAAELGALLVEEGETEAAETTVVTVECGDETITLRVVDPVTGKTLERCIEEDSLHPVARDRFLALAIVELVAASWIELEVTPEPAVPPADRTASDATRELARVAATEATRPPTTVRIALVVAVSMVGDPLRGSFGGGARVDHEPDALFGWSLALWGEHAEVSTELGGIAIDQLGGQLEATLRGRVGAAWIQGAVGARCTAVILNGAASSPDVTASTFVAPALGPHGALRVWLEPLSGFYVGLGATFAWTLLSAHGLVEGRRAVSVDGPALVGELALGFRVD